MKPHINPLPDIREIRDERMTLESEDRQHLVGDSTMPGKRLLLLLCIGHYYCLCSCLCLAMFKRAVNVGWRVKSRGRVVVDCYSNKQQQYNGTTTEAAAPLCLSCDPVHRYSATLVTGLSQKCTIFHRAFHMGQCAVTKKLLTRVVIQIAPWITASERVRS